MQKFFVLMPGSIKQKNHGIVKLLNTHEVVPQRPHPVPKQISEHYVISPWLWDPTILSRSMWCNLLQPHLVRLFLVGWHLVSIRHLWVGSMREAPIISAQAQGPAMFQNSQGGLLKQTVFLGPSANHDFQEYIHSFGKYFWSFTVGNLKKECTLYGFKTEIYGRAFALEEFAVLQRGKTCICKLNNNTYNI